VDLASWRRTAPLRRGEARAGNGPPAVRRGPEGFAERWAASDPPAARRTSATTWLASATAGSVAVAAVLAATPWTLVRAGALAGAGMIALGGLAERVVGVEVAPGELVVRRAGVPDQRARWAEIRELRPPRLPLGAWRIRSEGRVISLMPSDLLRGERALVETVRRSGLAFDGSVWRRLAGSAGAGSG